MHTKAAPFGSMVAQRDWPQLDSIYRRTLWQAMAVYVVGCVGLIGVMELLRWLQHPIAARLLDLPTTLIFMTASGFNQLVFCRSVYLRAHKAEPFYVLHLVNGAIVGVILVVLTPRATLPTIALAYLLGACLPVLIISGVIFRRYRAKMHGSCPHA